MRVPIENGQRVVDRCDLFKYEAPLYKVSTSGREVVVYYADDDIPQWLIEANAGVQDAGPD